MTRRESILAAASLAAGAILPSTVDAAPVLRDVHKWHNGQWVKCRLFNLQDNDIFRFDGEGGPQYVADGAPYRCKDRVWGIGARYQLDANNEWQPIASA